MQPRQRLSFSRRKLLLGTGAAGLALGAGGIFMPRISRASSRPQLGHGLQSGDIGAHEGVVWARADREARMTVEWSTTENFANPHRVQWLDVSEAADFAGKINLTGLPSDQDIFYRVKFLDLADMTSESETLSGHFRTAPMSRRDLTFVWSGDTVGQGWGIDVDRGGMKCYAAMTRHQPDFFIHSGDTIYADGPVVAEKEMPDGGIWKSLVVEEKAKVAETLNEFRAQWKYNLLDEHLRAFNAAIPAYVQWDDHEVTNNWYPGEMLIADERYKVKSSSLLASRAVRAFHEMNPIRPNPDEPYRVYRKIPYGPLLDIVMLDMRTYRGKNSRNDQATRSADTSFLGRDQIDWIKRCLLESTATWKVMAADMPLGLIVPDGETGSFENGANGDGPVKGREFDVAEILSFIKANGIKNVVWLTADVHYTAAHYYDPNKAQFQDFLPFWEFVSGPLHAGTFGPNQLDNTFGPEVKFVKAPEEGKVNLPPSFGLQFFGHVKIDGKTEVMTVTLRDADDQKLWAIDLTPEATSAI
ncbi:alkaline phosphatase [Dongia sp.]|uniref:alkaline phosphatase D family protein n=1 Tax=Dongia sp. TaxID=1977262 RepID=UPI0035AE8837